MWVWSRSRKVRGKWERYAIERTDDRRNSKSASATTHPESMSLVSAAVLTVSDTASVNHLLDKSGPTAADFLRGHGYRVLQTEIVPDEIQLIRQSITAWVNDRSHPIDLIVTTGGTGFGVRDVTPEVFDPPSIPPC